LRICNPVALNDARFVVPSVLGSVQGQGGRSPVIRGKSRWPRSPPALGASPPRGLRRVHPARFRNDPSGARPGRLLGQPPAAERALI